MFLGVMMFYNKNIGGKRFFGPVRIVTQASMMELKMLDT
jgi:hypothetical protein